MKLKNFLLALALLFTPNMHCMDDFNDYEFDMDDDDALGELLACNPDTPATRAVAATDIIPILTKVNAPDLLAQDYILRTNGLNRRSNLDFPLFELYPCCQPECSWTLGGQLYFNQLNRMYFSQNRDCIDAYLALSHGNLIKELQTTADTVKNLFAADNQLDIDHILCLFRPFTVQERQAGIMFNGLYVGDWGEFRFLVPVFYVERNYWLRSHEIQALEDEFGKIDPCLQAYLQKMHLVSDKFGLGDTRLNWLLAFDACNQIRVGFLLTLPTATVFSKKIMGNSFPKKTCPANFKFQSLFNLVEQGINETTQEEAFRLLEKFFLGSLDRISSSLLEAKLGNGRHVGLGLIARTDSPLLSTYYHSLVWKNRISAEYLFPRRRLRNFVIRNPQSIFSNADFTDESQAEENLLILQDAFNNKFNPLAFEASVHPGVVARWTTHFCYERNNFTCIVGHDMWYKSREIIKHIQAAPAILSRLNVDTARRPHAFQAQLFATIGGTIPGKNSDLYLSLNGAGTYAQIGIGHDFMVSLQFEHTF